MSECIYTKKDVAEVVLDVVQERGVGYRDYTHSLFNHNGQGSCFVGVVMEKFGITPRLIGEGKLMVRILSRAGLWARFAPDPNVLDCFEFRNQTTGETFRFEEGVGRLLSQSISLNDSGGAWGEIAKAFWGVDAALAAQPEKECFCPLCDPEARIPVYHPVWKPEPVKVYDPMMKFTGLETVEHPVFSVPSQYMKQLVSAVV